MQLHIPVILGTARENRESYKPAQYLHNMLAAYQPDLITTELVDIRDFASVKTVPSWEPNDTTNRWLEIVKRSDGFIFVVPEYNHSFPGELKIFLDGVYPEYARKPAIACGVSIGMWGGVRAVDHLNHVLSSLGMCVITKSHQNVYFPKVKELFDADGNIVDPETYDEQAKKMFVEVVWYAQTLQHGRMNIQ